MNHSSMCSIHSKQKAIIDIAQSPVFLDRLHNLSVIDIVLIDKSTHMEQLHTSYSLRFLSTVDLSSIHVRRRLGPWLPLSLPLLPAI
jgi:hypothetical protein